VAKVFVTWLKKG